MSARNRVSPAAGLLTTRQAANYLKVSERTLFSLTHPRGPLVAVRIGRIVRYHPDDINRFLNLTRPDTSLKYTQNQTQGQNNEVN